MELDLAPVSMSSVLEDAVAMVRERAARRSVSLTFEPRRRSGTRLGRRAQAQAGRPEPAHERRQVHERGRLGARLRARSDGGRAQVEVRDTGIGIADDEQERVFEAFQRGGRDVRTSTEGTGLGLTLSKRIVELHGGRMWMESRLGVGSTFGFAIPAPRQREVRAPKSLRPWRPPPRTPETSTGRRDRRRPARPRARRGGARPRGLHRDPCDQRDGGSQARPRAPAGRRPARSDHARHGRIRGGRDASRRARHRRRPDRRADPQGDDARRSRPARGDRINHLAQKGELDRARLVALVGGLADRRGEPRDDRQRWSSSWRTTRAT